MADAADGSTVTIHLDEGRRADLDAIAAATARDRASIIEEAINAYLGLEAWRHQHILEGLRQADAGEFATDEEVDEAYHRPR